MKISIIQPDTVWESKQKNFNRLEQLIDRLDTDTQIIILPEMFSTGFSMNARALSESHDGETSEWMTHIAVKRKAGICGSYIISHNSLYYNRWVFISPEKQSWYYDKRHLFSPAGENDIFSPGNSRIVFKFRGIKILPTVCYDLRFPVWSRNTESYDLLINSANWPAARKDVWMTLLRARAMENQCYVAGANRTGVDGNGYIYSGESLIVNPYGNIAALAPAESETSISADLSKEELLLFRKKFPVLKDVDSFTLNT